jgi:type I restriction enzyme S subunit
VKLLAYTEYKPSGIDWLGNIPSHWNSVKIKRKYKIVNGSTPSSADSINWGGDIIWITPADFSQANFGYIKTSQRQITEEGLISCGTTLIPKKSIVISTRAPIGEVVQSAQELCTNQGCKSLVLDSDNAYERFHYYALLCNSEKLNSLGLGTTFMELSKNDLGNFYVPIPPMDEQIQIANILDHKTTQIDRLIEKKKALIEKLNEKRIALITQAVTKGLNPDAPMKSSGVDWLGDVPAHWDIAKFKFHIGFQEGPGIMAVDFRDSGVPLLRIRNVQSDYVNLDDCNYLDPEKVESQWPHFKCKIEDLLISGSASTGLVCEITEDSVGAIVYTGLIRLWPETGKVAKEYIRWLVSSGMFFSQIDMFKTGSTIQHFGPEHLNRMLITVPPLEEQQSISEYIKISLSKIDKMISINSQAIERLTEYRTALITAAVTGKIDVSSIEISDQEAA